ncbi:hypothetical protein ES703_10267 [subsurface metagenome]
MKVLAINSSPKMDKGNTALILNPFLEGMREAGAEVELFYTKKLKINPCQGEYICMFKTPGKCFQNDDMEMLLPKLGDADVWVLATPVYVDGVTASMKTVMERMNPLMLPFTELHDGHSFHPRREGTKRSKVVLVSTCGFWEMDNFDLLLAHLRAYCRNADREFAGALLRPHGGGLKEMREMGMLFDDVFEAAKEAGRQLVRDGEMAPETLATVSRELIPLEASIEMGNEYIKQALDALEK